MYAQKPWLKFYDEGVRATIDYPEKPLASLLREGVEKHPERLVYIYYGQECTFARLEALTRRLAASLHAMGIGKGDRISLMLPNCPQFVIAYFAITSIGAIIVNTNPQYTPREIAYILNDSEAETIITFVEAAPLVEAVLGQTPLKRVIYTSLQGKKPEKLPEGSLWLEDLIAGSAGEPPAVDIDPREDVAVLQYTGGTTGVPKAAMLTHFNLVSNAVQLNDWCTGTDMQRILSVLPFFHVFGMTCCMNLSLVTGATMILLPRFDAKEVLENIKRYKPTLFPGVPTMFSAILNHPDIDQYDLGDVEFYDSGAAPMPMELIEALRKRLEGKNSVYLEGYGLSEASPVTHSNPSHGVIKAGSIGIPYPDVECRIVDIETGERDMPVGEVGELIIKGPQVMKGYWRRPDETALVLRDGWLYTGDIALMDEDGYFYIVDRKKDMILAGGYNIYPREVEEVIYEMPQVQEVVVAGVPDLHRGEIVKAYIVPRQGASLTAEEVIEFCRERLAPYKVPRQVEFREQLPKSAVGKLLRRLLVEEEKRRMAAGE